MLQGHERAITQIKYNREGDLLFSAAKDSKPNVWWSLNGERLGTFNGHGGVVWCLDVDWQTINLITGGGDSSCRFVFHHKLIRLAEKGPRYHLQESYCKIVVNVHETTPDDNNTCGTSLW